MRISKYLPDIIKRLSEVPILFLMAPTGSGKSLGLPAALSVIGVRVFVSVPTRTAVLSLANTQKMLVPNVNVGYAAESDIKYDDTSKIVYVTSGHLRRKILNTYMEGQPSAIDFCDVLILDEIHSGSLDNTINLALWEKAAREGHHVPRLILASATFPENLKSRFPEASTFEIEGQTFPVEVQYHDKSFDPRDNSGDLYRELASVIRNLLIKIPKGDLLAFLPGSAEVNSVSDLLTEPAIPGCEILLAFGAMKTEELQKIYGNIPGKRKVILATNIAETSLTIDNLDIIVDLMLEKLSETSSSGGLRLTLNRISQDSAIQRCGRTGRIRAGFCYRMITEKEYISLEQKRLDEIHRLPLSGTLLELTSIGLDPENILSDVDPNKIRNTLNLLVKIGCLTINLTITGKGKFSSDFPLSVRNACVLYEWTLTNKPLFPALVTIALIDSFGPSYLWIPRKEQKESVSEYSVRSSRYRKDYFDSFKGKSDVATFLNLWHNFMNEVGGYPAKDYDVRKWCRETSIHYRKWKEMLNILKTCINTVKRLGYKVEIGPFTTNGVISAMKPIFEDVYRDMILISVGAQYQDKNGLRYRLDSRSTVNGIDPAIDHRIIALITIELSTGGGGSGFRLVSVALDLQKKDEGKGDKSEILASNPVVRTPISISNIVTTDLDEPNVNEISTSSVSETAMWKPKIQPSNIVPTSTPTIVPTSTSVLPQRRRRPARISEKPASSTVDISELAKLVS